jgi:fructosamine-3-kinase
LIFPEPKSLEVKPGFSAIPEEILQDIAKITGVPVLNGEVAFGGFSAAASYILTLRDGRKIFAKGNHPEEMAHGAENLRQEIFTYEHVVLLKKLSPAYLGTVTDGDEDGWLLGLWEYVPHAPKTPSSEEVIKTLVMWHSAGASETGKGFLKDCHEQNFISLFFNAEKKWCRIAQEDKTREKFLSLFKDPAIAKIWAEKNVPKLCALQERIIYLPVTGVLLHGDLRRDNIFTGMDGGIRVIDWPNACIGPAEFDLFFLFADMAASGGISVIELFELYEKAGGQVLGKEWRYVIGACIAGYFADQAYRDIPLKLPRLRWMQKGLLWGVLRYLAAENVVESIPVMADENR